MNSSEDAIQQELQRLVGRMLGVGLTDGEDVRMCEILDKHPHFVEDYVAQVTLDSMLKWEMTGADSRELLPAELSSLLADKSDQARISETRGGRLPSVAPVRSWLALAAAVMIVAACLGLIWRMSPPWRQNDVVPQEYVATLLDSEDARWDGETGPGKIPFGTKLLTGQVLSLDSGIARIRFRSGAGIVLEGPAELELRSELDARLSSGKLAAYVPDEAIGFTVETPEVRIVDLGTRFGAEVGGSGEADIHVFEGEVDVVPLLIEPERRSTRLRTNEAKRFSPSDITGHLISFDRAKFADLPTIEQLKAASVGVYPPPAPVIDRRGTKVLPTTASPSDALPDGILAGDSFAHDGGSLHGKTGAVGFGGHPWEADEQFTELIDLAAPLRWNDIDGGRRAVSLHGRDPAYPAVANRITRELASVVKSDLYFSVLGRYTGLDDDDFFALWFDNRAFADDTHHDAPNVGIQAGQYFARLTRGSRDVTSVENHAKRFGSSADGETFLLVGRLFKDRSEYYNRIALWVNPEDAREMPPDVLTELEGDSSVSSARRLSLFTMIGVRMGSHTEPDDRLVLDRFILGTSYRQVLAPIR